MKPTSSGCCSLRFLQRRQHVSYESHASPARRKIGCLPIAKFMIPSYESWMRITIGRQLLPPCGCFMLTRRRRSAEGRRNQNNTVSPHEEKRHHPLVRLQVITHPLGQDKGINHAHG